MATGITFCDATTATGQRCRKPALAGEDQCSVHHPAYSEWHRKNAAKGGRKKAPRNVTAPLNCEGVDLTTLDGLREFLARALKRLAELTFDARVANAVAVLAAQQRTILQDSEFERRIASLEDTAEQLGREPWQR